MGNLFSFLQGKAATFYGATTAQPNVRDHWTPHRPVEHMNGSSTNSLIPEGHVPPPFIDPRITDLNMVPRKGTGDIDPRFSGRPDVMMIERAVKNMNSADQTRVSDNAVQDVAAKAILMAANAQARQISYGAQY
jgi:hypothetical protein